MRAEYVASALVARQHAVRNQEGAGTNVIGDDVERIRAVILNAQDIRRGLDEVSEQIDVVVTVHALHHGRSPLQAHSCIHRWLRNGVIVPSAERSNCMKTRFQIST